MFYDSRSLQHHAEKESSYRPFVRLPRDSIHNLSRVPKPGHGYWYTFLLNLVQNLSRFHKFLNAGQEPQFCEVGPTLQGKKENDTESTEPESTTVYLERNKREIRYTWLSFDPSKLKWFVPLIFHQGKTWCFRTTWQQRRKGRRGCIKSERWA